MPVLKSESCPHFEIALSATSLALILAFNTLMPHFLSFSPVATSRSTLPVTTVSFSAIYYNFAAGWVNNNTRSDEHYSSRLSAHMISANPGKPA